MTTAVLNEKNLTSFDLYKLGLSTSRTVRTQNHGTSRTIRVGMAPKRVSEVKHLNARRVQAAKSSSKSIISPRRILIVLLIAVSVLAIMLPATTAFGRRSLVSSERPSAEMRSNVISVVVEEGDTLWSIAQKLEPKRDPREIVDQLVKARGTANVYAGETIEWTR